MSFLERFFRLREESDQVKPFLQHLEEFRWMLIKMASTLVLFMMGSFFFRHQLVRIVQEPLRRVDPALVSSLQTLGVVDSMTISFTLSFYAGLVLSFPLLLFFLAQFIVPALTKKEKKSVFPAITFGFGLFLLGVCFSYFWVLPQALSFFKHDAESMGWTPNWRVREYYAFVTQMTLGLGMAFELPVGVLLAVYLGFLSYDLLNRTRPYAYVLVLILAAVIAPTPDIMTFLSMGIPMCLLYEGCIWMAWFIDRRKKRRIAEGEQ